MSYSRFHWRTFNILARLFGLGMLLAGFIGLSQLVFAKAVPGENVGLVFVVSVFAVVVGVLVVRVAPFRPDLDGYASSFEKTEGRGRTWWTGEPE